MTNPDTTCENCLEESLMRGPAPLPGYPLFCDSCRTSCLDEQYQVRAGKLEQSAAYFPAPPW